MRLSVKTLPDRVVGELVNLSYNLQNEVFLTPDNLLDTIGDPRYLDPGFGEFEDGLLLYGGTDPQELEQQNEQPIPFTQHSYFWRTINENGGPPPDPSVVDNDIPQPKAPRYRLQSATGGGFKSANYDVFYSGLNDKDQSTLLSPTFFIPNTAIFDSQQISMLMPSVPSQWSKLAWWMAWDGGTPYLQATLDLIRSHPVDFDLEGPYRWQRASSGYNETYIGQAPTVTAYYEWSSLSLPAGNYKFFYEYVTANGTSLPGSATAAKTYTVPSTYNNTLLSVYAPSQRSGAIGWKLYALQSDGRYYVIYPGNSNPDRPLGFDEWVYIRSWDPSGWPLDANGAPVDYAAALSDFDPSRAVDTSGIPDPQDQPSPNIPDPALYNSYGVFGGSGLHDSGTVTYYIAFAALIGGIEGPRGKTVRVPNVGAGQGIRLYPPKQVQHLRNAEQTETGNDGLPLDIVVTNSTATGVSASSQPGYTQISLTGVTGTANAPEIQTTPVNLKDDSGNLYTWTIQGELQVSSYSGVTPGATGEARVRLEQFSVDSDTWVNASTKPSPIAGATIDLTLETGTTKIDQTGSERFEKTVLPTDNFWNPAAVSARLVAYTPQGVTRTMIWNVIDLGMHPQEHTPEKFEERDPDDADADDDADPPPHRHHHERQHHKAHKHKRKKHPRRGRPHPMVDRPTTPGTVLNTWTFESGEDRSSLVPTGGPTISSPAAISGSQGFLAQDTSTSAFNPVSYTYSFFDSRTWLGVRPAIRVVALPTTGTVEVLWVWDQNGYVMAILSLDATGTLTAYGHNIDGSNPWQKNVAHTSGGNAIANGDIIRPELVLTGGNHDDGLIRVWYSNSRNQTTYSLFASNESDKISLDWTGRRPVAYQFGLNYMSSISATTTLHFDDVIVTDNGITDIRDRYGTGQVIHQGTAYTPDNAGHKVRHNVLPASTRVAAKPSQWYAYGYYSRWVGLQRDQEPFHVSGELLDGGSVDFGSPHGGKPINGKHGWAEYANVFETPDTCYELTIAGRNIHVGKIKYQELCLTELTRPPLAFITNSSTDTITTSDVHGLVDGNVVKVLNQGGVLPSGLDVHSNYYVINSTSTTMKLAFLPGGSAVDITTTGTGQQILIRDLPKRTGARATSGSLRSTFNTDTPKRGSYGPAIPRVWTRAGVTVGEQPAGTSVDTIFRSSNATFFYSRPYTDIADTPYNKFLEINATLSGDGFFSPVVTGDSPFVEQSLRVATLLREDGSEFPGGVIVTGAQTPANIPNVEIRTKLDKSVERHIIAAPLGSVAAFKLQLFTEEAVREILETWVLPDYFFRIEYRGKAVTIKPREQIDIKQEPDKQVKSVDPVTGLDYYYIYAQADVSGAEIVSEASL